MRRQLALACIIACGLVQTRCKVTHSASQLAAVIEEPLDCSRIVALKELQNLKLKHPGGLMGIAELQRLRSVKSSSDPIQKAAVQTLLAFTPLDYQPKPQENLRIEYDKTPGMVAQHQALVEKDGVQAYQQALAFLITCDTRYADNTQAILKAWATTNKTFAGENAPLEGGWAIASMARAAELLKYTDKQWNPEVEKLFLKWVEEKIEPRMNSMVRKQYYAWHNNWHTTIAEAKLQLAILRDDAVGFDEMIAYYERIIDGKQGIDPRTNKQESDRYIMASGQTKETCRDLAHAQFAMGSLLQIPEIAWHQGQDLYAKKQTLLIKMMEFHAPLVRGKPIGKGVTDVDPDPKKFGKPCVMTWVGFQPTWEIGFHHFVRRLGLELPESAKTLEQFRPEKYIFHWGLGTLTHYEAPAIPAPK